MACLEVSWVGEGSRSTPALRGINLGAAERTELTGGAVHGSTGRRRGTSAVEVDNRLREPARYTELLRSSRRRWLDRTMAESGCHR
jgi:hypothetical protein